MNSLPEKHEAVAVTLAELKLKINSDLYSAFQRCSWIIVHETGRSQIDVMNEMVEDFLRKHGC